MRKWDKLSPYPHSHHNRLAFLDRRLTPLTNLLASTTDPFQVQLRRSHMERIADTFEKDTMLRLRKVVDVQSRSAEMKALLREWEVAGREAEAAEPLPDTFEHLDPFMDPFTKFPDEDLFSDGQEPGTGDSSWTSEESQTRDAMAIFGDIRFTMLSWMKSIWQLCVDKVHRITVDDWIAGHGLLIYIANVAQTVRDSRYYQVQTMEGWLLMSTSGQMIRTFDFEDSCRDIIWLAMWIWRDIFVAGMAQGIMTDTQVLSLLKEIRTTVDYTFYSDLFEIKALPPPNQVPTFSLRVTNAITVICPHWSSEQGIAFKNFRALYFRKHIANFCHVPSIKLYKHIVFSSPSSKHTLLSHLQSLWTPDNILSLTDHDIIVIVGYYLTEHNHNLLLNFLEHLSSRGRECPFAAAIAAAREWVKWDAWRVYAAHLVQDGLELIRDELATEIYKVTDGDDEYWDEIRQSMEVWSPGTDDRLRWETIWCRLDENFPSWMDEEWDTQIPTLLPPLDEMLYTRFLAWLEILAAFPQTPPGTPCPAWAPEQIVSSFYVDSKKNGLMSWITRKCGYQLARGMADAFNNRKELEYLGSTLYDLCVAFLPLTPGLENHKDVGTDEGESMYSEEVKRRCVQS